MLAVERSGPESHYGWVSEFDAFQRQGRGGDGRMVGKGGEIAVLAPVSGSDTKMHPGKGGLALVSNKSLLARADDVNPAKVLTERSMTDDLKAEMKLLHWHKLANEAALKAAIIKTKQMKSVTSGGEIDGVSIMSAPGTRESRSRGGGLAALTPPRTAQGMSVEERAAWMQQIIEEEQSKPLHVSADFIAAYEGKEQIMEDRLDREVRAHIQSLKTLRDQVEKREESRQRRARYKEEKKVLDQERVLLSAGKLLPPSPMTANKQREGDATGVADAPETQIPAPVGALDTVLSSLDKLLELEKRIASLETANVYDDFVSQQQAGTRSQGGVGGSAAGSLLNSTAPPSRSKLQFSKKRESPSINTPSKVYYAAQMVKVSPSKGGVGQGSRVISAAGGGVGLSIRSSQQQAKTTLTRKYGSTGQVRGGGGGTNRGTFMTSLPELGRGMRAGARQGGVGVPGGHRSAAMEQKRRLAKRKVARDEAEAARIQRQDKIIRGWMETKRRGGASLNNGVGSSSRINYVYNRQRRRVAPGANSVKGMSAGRTEGNIHMQQFRDIRAEYTKRKEALKSGLMRGSKPVQRGTTSSHPYKGLANASTGMGKKPLHATSTTNHFSTMSSTGPDARGRTGGFRRSGGPLLRRSRPSNRLAGRNANKTAGGRSEKIRARSFGLHDNIHTTNSSSRARGARGGAGGSGGVRAVRAVQQQRRGRQNGLSTVPAGPAMGVGVGETTSSYRERSLGKLMQQQQQQQQRGQPPNGSKGDDDNRLPMVVAGSGVRAVRQARLNAQPK